MWNKHFCLFKKRKRNVTLSSPRHRLYNYHAGIASPRPESYLDDWNILKNIDEEHWCEIMNSIASTAESGWDFSSRWLKPEEFQNTTDASSDQVFNILNLNTPRVYPTDLNALIAWNFKFLANNTRSDSRREEYLESYAQTVYWMRVYLFSEEDQSFYDYHWNKEMKENEGKRKEKYAASNFFPFWLKTYSGDENKFDQALYNKIIELGLIDDYETPIPATFVESGQQWDFPNVWAPSVYAVIQGLKTVDRKMAVKAAEKFVNSAMKGFEEYGVNFEKYDARIVGKSGSGGEYGLQTGFGWTNGVVLSLLDEFGEEMGVPGGAGSGSSIVSMVSSMFILATFCFIK